jgi:ABC-type phosphate transport system substrate-binding protein
LRRAALVVGVLAVLTTVAAPPVASAEARFRVIVHAQVRGTQIPRAALSSIFLGRASKWGDGTEVRPVDQSLRSSLRLSFTTDVLQQDLIGIQMYWQREIMRGHVPPPVKSSDEEIVAFVASNPGAVGYVSPGTPLPDTVREVAVVN